MAQTIGLVNDVKLLCINQSMQYAYIKTFVIFFFENSQMEFPPKKTENGNSFIPSNSHLHLTDPR